MDRVPDSVQKAFFNPQSGTKPLKSSMRKYVKMLKIGMPEHVLRSKMTHDGVPKSEQEAFFNSKALSSKAGDTLNPSMAKYEKMKEMGMPEHVLRSKMKFDGVPKSEMEAFFNPQSTKSEEKKDDENTNDKEQKEQERKEKEEEKEKTLKSQFVFFSLNIYGVFVSTQSIP